MNQRIYSNKIKQQVKLLRGRDGLSYKEIADKVGIPKSTATLWCKNIIVKSEHRERLYTKQIKLLSNGPRSSHERRKNEIENIIENAEKEIPLPLSTEAHKLFGAALYWAEGNKTKHFAITNSDPCLIKFMIGWLRNFLDIHPKNITAHLNIYPQQNDKKLKKFWSEVTGISLENFGKSFVKPANKDYKKNTLYYGTIKIRVRKGTDFRHRVFGWINSVLRETGSQSNESKAKWHKLETDYSKN